MKKVEGLEIKYIGYNKPQTPEEVDLEILGLRTAIAAAEQRIAVLTQSVMVQYLMNEATIEETSDEKTVEKTSESDKAK